MATVITQAQAAAKVAFYLDLEERVAAGQTVQHGDKRLTMADLDQVRKSLTYWTSMHDRLAAVASGKSGNRYQFAEWNN